MAFIAITYVSTQDACDKAYRYFRRSSKLSKYKRIGRGHYEFTFHVPTLWTRQDVEETFRIAFAGVKYSPPIIEELPIDVTPEPSKPTPTEQVLSNGSAYIVGSHAMRWEGDTITIEFRSNAEAQAFFNRHTIGRKPN